jgi:hypothetical protein
VRLGVAALLHPRGLLRLLRALEHGEPDPPSPGIDLRDRYVHIVVDGDHLGADLDDHGDEQHQHHARSDDHEESSTTTSKRDSVRHDYHVTSSGSREGRTDERRSPSHERGSMSYLSCLRRSEPTPSR